MKVGDRVYWVNGIRWEVCGGEIIATNVIDGVHEIRLDGCDRTKNLLAYILRSSPTEAYEELVAHQKKTLRDVRAKLRRWIKSAMDGKYDAAAILRAVTMIDEHLGEE